MFDIDFNLSAYFIHDNRRPDDSLTRKVYLFGFWQLLNECECESMPESEQKRKQEQLNKGASVRIGHYTVTKDRYFGRSFIGG